MGQEQPVKQKEPEKTLKCIVWNKLRTSERLHKGNQSNEKRVWKIEVQVRVSG